MNVLTTTVLCLALPSLAVAGQNPTTPAPSPTTQSETAMKSSANDFIEDAVRGGMAEVELGQLASQKATNQKVKSFGAQMVTDHSNANDQLKTLASSKRVTIPTDMSAEQKSKRDELNGLSGEAFDKAYVDAMVEDHRKDVDEFKKQATSNEDADVRAFAKKTLPTLQQHLRLIERIQKDMSGSKRSSSD